jgi:hypothetical protein
LSDLSDRVKAVCALNSYQSWIRLSNRFGLRPRLEWNYSGHVIQAAPSVPPAIVAAANDFSLCGAAAFQIAAFNSFHFEMCK